MRLCKYEKVLLLDADTLFLSSIKYLFDLHTPAGCFVCPWSDSFLGGSTIPDYYQSSIIKHGSLIS